MRHTFIGMGVCTLLSGCLPLRPNPYQSTYNALAAMEGTGATVADVSAVFAHPPDKCEDISERPKVGLGCGRQSVSGPRSAPIVGFLPAGFPAQKAGIAKGDRVLFINGTKIQDCEQLVSTLQLGLDAGRPIEVITTTGTYILTPEARSGQQCYWHVSGGQVSKFQGSTGWGYDPWLGGGGGGAAGGSSYERYMEMSCRFLPTLYFCSGTSQY